MTANLPPEAWLSEDGRTVHMRRGGWKGSFPVEALEDWLAFYRQLRDRKGGKFAAFYAPAVEALERIESELRSGGATGSASASRRAGDPSSDHGRLRLSTSESCIMRRPRLGQ